MTDVHLGFGTVEDVMRIYRVSRRYVYKIAWRDRWRRYTLDGKVRYHHGDVAKSLGR